MMLDGMRAASFGDPMFGSDEGDMYQSMMDDQLAVEMSQGKGLGLADLLIRQLSHGGDGAAARKVCSRLGEAAKQEFIEKMLPQAQAAGRELGVDPRAIIAQAALETGWGTSQPADASGNSHNLFGIKAGAELEGRVGRLGNHRIRSGRRRHRSRAFPCLRFRASQRRRLRDSLTG